MSVSRAPMSTVSQTQKNKDNLFLNLSSSLTISVSTTDQVNIKNVPENVTISVSTTDQVNIENVPENVTIELVKEQQYRHVGEPKLLRQAVLHLSYAGFLQLKSSTNSIHSFLNFIGDLVEYAIEAADERQHQASETTTATPPLKTTILSGKEDPWLPEQIFNELKDRDGVVEIVVFLHTPRYRGKQYVVTMKQSVDFNFCIFYV